MTVESFSPMIQTQPSRLVVVGVETGDVDRKDSMDTVCSAISDTSSTAKCTMEAGILEKGWGKNDEFPHDADTDHVDVLCKGFEIIAFGATCLSAVQSQVMFSTLTGLSDSTAVRAVNAFYLSGLIFDLIAACLAFLTSRWLQRLTNSEKHYLQDVFAVQAKAASEGAGTPKLKSTPELERSRSPDQNNNPATSSVEEEPFSFLERIFISWFSLALFAPMVFLVLGGVCILAGLYTYTWSQQPLPVAVVVSFTGLSTLPFIIGVFAIGRVDQRRRRIIRRLSRIQGDW